MSRTLQTTKLTCDDGDDCGDDDDDAAYDDTGSSESAGVLHDCKIFDAVYFYGHFFFYQLCHNISLCMPYHLHVFTSSYFHVDEYDFSHFFKTTLQKNTQEEPTSPPTYAWAYEKCISIGFVNVL